MSDELDEIPDSKLLRETIAQFTFGSSTKSPRRSAQNARAQNPSAHISTEPSSVKVEGEELEDPIETPQVRRFSRKPASTKLEVKSEVLHQSSVTSKRERASTSDIARPAKKQRGYAAPEKYAHLEYLPDHLKSELDVLFCGINPGFKSATDGHHYAHPTNHFWLCLHLSGFTERQLPASEDSTLPEAYNVGLTNLIERPSAEQTELSKDEMRTAAPRLLKRVAACRPRIVAFVGKDIWLNVEKELLAMASTASYSLTTTSPSSLSKKPASFKRPRSVFSWDIQPYKLVYNTSEGSSVHETLFFALPSTSARVVRYQREEKVKIFKTLYNRLQEVKEETLDTSSMLSVSANSLSP